MADPLATVPHAEYVFLWAEGQVESGGNYRAVNENSGALGRWQVMPQNVAPWTEQAWGFSVSGSTFLHDNLIQDGVAVTILGGYWRRYGPAGAAAMWYSGQPNPNATFGDPPVWRYVDNVLAEMGQNPVQPGGNIPAPRHTGADLLAAQWSYASWTVSARAYSRERQMHELYAYVATIGR